MSKKPINFYDARHQEFLDENNWKEHNFRSVLLPNISFRKYVKEGEEPVYHLCILSDGKIVSYLLMNKEKVAEIKKLVKRVLSE
jgi:hypothetical protein